MPHETPVDTVWGPGPLPRTPGPYFREYGSERSVTLVDPCGRLGSEVRGEQRTLRWSIRTLGRKIVRRVPGVFKEFCCFSNS